MKNNIKYSGIIKMFGQQSAFSFYADIILINENNCQSKCIASERFYNAGVISGN